MRYNWCKISKIYVILETSENISILRRGKLKVILECGPAQSSMILWILLTNPFDKIMLMTFIYISVYIDGDWGVKENWIKPSETMMAIQVLLRLNKLTNELCFNSSKNPL